MIITKKINRNKVCQEQEQNNNTSNNDLMILLMINIKI